MQESKCFKNIVKINCAEERKRCVYFEKSSEQKTRLYIEGKKSWVDIFYLPVKILENLDFEQLWNLHPEEKGTVKIFGKPTKIPRYQQSYGINYFFSGMEHDCEEVPGILNPIVELFNSSEYVDEETHFNQVVVNWYTDGSDYIGPHSDNEKQIVKRKDGTTSIPSITLQEGKANRIFR